MLIFIFPHFLPSHPKLSGYGLRPIAHNFGLLGRNAEINYINKSFFRLECDGVVEAITQEAEKSCPNLMTSSYLSLFGGITPPPWDNTWVADQADKENLLIISGRNLINNFVSHIQPTFLSPKASVPLSALWLTVITTIPWSLKYVHLLARSLP